MYLLNRPKEIYIGISSKLATTLIILNISLITNTCYSHPEHLRGSGEYWQTHKSINRICKL